MTTAGGHETQPMCGALVQIGSNPTPIYRVTEKPCTCKAGGYVVNFPLPVMPLTSDEGVT